MPTSNDSIDPRTKLPLLPFPFAILPSIYFWRVLRIIVVVSSANKEAAKDTTHSNRSELRAESAPHQRLRLFIDSIDSSQTLSFDEHALNTLLPHQRTHYYQNGNIQHIFSVICVDIYLPTSAYTAGPIFFFLFFFVNQHRNIFFCLFLSLLFLFSNKTMMR